MPLTSKPISELSTMLSKKEISSKELTEAYLNNIKNDQTHAQPVNAYITVTEELALKGAQEADQRIHNNTHTVLTGIPLGVKDLINVKDVKNTCASKIMADFVSPYDATIITKLIRNEGMPHLGKLNMDEFAMGSSNETSYFGPVRNPINKEFSPGGSSGGSAASVTAQLAPVALGTDTGGSIRQPAALCGCVGFKPTYGRISRYGVTAFASSLDQVGPISQTVQDAAMIYNAMAGHDPMDATSLQHAVEPVTPNQQVKGLKIGLPKEFFDSSLNEEIKTKILDTAKNLEKEGAILSEVSIPNLKHAPAVYYILAPAEASSNLARFDGIRYGFRTPNAQVLSETYINSRTEGFGSEVKRRIMLGTFILSSESYEEFFVKAQKVRNLLIQEHNAIFQSVDVLLGPTTPSTAFKIGEKINDPIAMYLNDIFTISANLVGSPAISIPIGISNETRLPIGLQLQTQRLHEKSLFDCAYAVELFYKT
ncbi:MAG: Asp-tRNA(Asn)/Glu-tRNA(Gln) amidotransferase subunit GatA [Brevinemataceae bacterium]